MNESVFRQKSIDRIQSPEDLNGYMRVTNPPVWIAICAMVAILCGTIVWGIFGKIETKAECVAISSGGKTVCYVSENDNEKIKIGMKVLIDGNEYLVTSVSELPLESDEIPKYAEYVRSLKEWKYVFEVGVNADLSEGNYEASVVTESINAFSFLWN